MPDWVAWAIAAAVLAAGEAATAALVLGPLALAAALAAIVAATGAGAIAQLAAFIIGSGAAIGILRLAQSGPAVTADVIVSANRTTPVTQDDDALGSNGLEEVVAGR